ncbi:MAG: hypothetical protein D6785_02415 [Planctomycetota bacterium]|nr:MAG: hypothetical protein D6785_02415 [Planctomycetota bacterium]
MEQKKHWGYSFFTIFFIIFWLGVFMLHDAFAQYSAFIPTWKVGDTWKVSIHPIAFGMPKKPGGMVKKRVKKKEYVNFKIEKLVDLDKTKCFEVKATNTVLPNQYHLLYIRYKDFTLKQFVEVHVVGGKEKKKVIKNPSKPFVYLQMGILCPFDFPKFPDVEKDTVTRTTLGLTNKKLTQLVSFNKDRTEMRVELRVKVNGKVLKSVQYWKKGYPFWTKAERTWGKEKWEIGKLEGFKLVPRKGL